MSTCKCVYLVTAATSRFVKVGMWSHCKFNLISRYVAVYGKTTRIHVYRCEENRRIESAFKQRFEDRSMMIRGELFTPDAIEEYRRYLGDATKSAAEVLTMEDLKDDKPIEEKDEEYRRERNITPEQVEENRKKKQETKESAHLFCMATSPDVDVVKFTITNRSAKDVADFYAMYYGPNTVVINVNTSAYGIPAHIIRERMVQACEKHNDIWTLYDKKHLMECLECMAKLGDFPIWCEKKQIRWVKNEAYDPKKKASRKTKRIAGDECASRLMHNSTMGDKMELYGCLRHSRQDRISRLFLTMMHYYFFIGWNAKKKKSESYIKLDGITI